MLLICAGVGKSNWKIGFGISSTTLNNPLGVADPSLNQFAWGA